MARVGTRTSGCCRQASDKQTVYVWWWCRWEIVIGWAGLSSREGRSGMRQSASEQAKVEWLTSESRAKERPIDSPSETFSTAAAADHCLVLESETNGIKY